MWYKNTQGYAPWYTVAHCWLLLRLGILYDDFPKKISNIFDNKFDFFNVLKFLSDDEFDLSLKL